MKRKVVAFIMLFVLVMVGLVAPMLVLAETEPWRDAYAALLWYGFEGLEGESRDTRQFLLHDINLDGTPELLVTYMHPTVRVYTFVDGMVVELELGEGVDFSEVFTYPNAGGIYAPSGNQLGLITVSIFPDAGESVFTHIIKDGNSLITLTRGLEYFSGAHRDQEFFIDDLAVSEEEFNYSF